MWAFDGLRAPCRKVFLEEPEKPEKRAKKDPACCRCPVLSEETELCGVRLPRIVGRKRRKVKAPGGFFGFSFESSPF